MNITRKISHCPGSSPAARWGNRVLSGPRFFPFMVLLMLRLSRNFSSILYPAHANRIWPVRSRDGWVGAWGEGRSGGNGVVYSAAKMGRNSQRLRYDCWLASKVRDGAENFVPIRKCFAQLRSDVFLSNLSSLPHPSRSNADLLDDTSRCCPCSPLLSRGEVFVRAVKRLALPFL